MLAAIFLLAVSFVAYAYVGYPAALAVAGTVRRRSAVAGDVRPAVSVIVAVHDGAPRLRAKLDNTLAQDYPAELLQIIVADDASTDEGPALVEREYAPRGVRLVRLAARGGKEAAQKTALAAATGSVVVFTDVGTRLDPGGVAAIVRPFADPRVGCVSSIDRFVTRDGRPAGEGLYVRYEMFLRRLETNIGSLVGMSGSFFAVRREVCGDFSDRLPSDFRSVIAASRLGLRAVQGDGAFGYYEDISLPGAELQRKIRTVLRGLTAFFAEIPRVNPFRSPLFWWQLLSHKLCRWLVPFALLAALSSSAALAPRSPAFAALFALQAALYAYSAAATVRPSLLRFRPGRAAHYFVLVNLSILVAWLRWARREELVAWTPTTR